MISAFRLKAVGAFAAGLAVTLADKGFGKKERKPLPQSFAAAPEHDRMGQTFVLYESAEVFGKAFFDPDIVKTEHHILWN